MTLLAWFFIIFGVITGNWWLAFVGFCILIIL